MYTKVIAYKPITDTAEVFDNLFLFQQHPYAGRASMNHLL